MRRVYITLFLIPVFILILLSVSGIWRYPNLLPESLSLRSISFLQKNMGDILLSILSSITYSIMTVILSLLLTILPASFLARDNMKGKVILEALLISPVLIPAITYSMGIHWIFIKTGLSDSFLGVILVLTMFSYPYMLRALTTGFLMYPKELEVTAHNLGASTLYRLLHIDLPLLYPSIMSGGTIVFLSSFSSYFLVFLIGGGRVPSFTGYLVPFLTAEDWNISAVLSILFLIIPVLLFLILNFLTKRSRYENRH